MPKIHLLEDTLISQIAAGEVVERPSSVVKELVENALDAGAAEVTVELEAGGKRRIVVADDGSGMSGDDALLAFDRHATSKIASFDDLEEVATLGFRGEALASIAAVARVEMRTAEEAGDGQRVRIEGGRVKSVEPVSHPRGTRLEIASLFFNVPARRKFLKQPQTELRRSVEVVQGYALARPDVRFTVLHEGRALVETLPGSDDLDGLRERIAQIFGRALAEKLHAIPVEFVGEREAITGFVGDRTTARGRKTFLYVNRRLVRDRALMARYYRAVRDVWHTEDYPTLFLFVDLEPEHVDVNVHPQKAEVRFRDSRVIDRVEDALRAALDAARTRGEAKLDEPRSLPELPASWEGLGGTPRRPEWDVGPKRAGARPPVGEGAEEAGDGPTSAGVDESGRYRWDPVPPSEIRTPEGRTPEGRTPEGRTPEGEPTTPIARASYRPIEPRDVPLSGRGKHLSPFRLLGQYKGSLILLEGHDGLYLVDQHAAHERILYERLRRTIHDRQPKSQRLLEPVLLELSSAEAMRLEEMTDALAACGFEVALLSGRDVALKAVPETLSVERAEALVRGLAAETGDDAETDVDALGRRLLDALAADLSCKAAIKIHRPMPPEEMQALVSELFAAEQPYACPHGRPTVLHLGDAELERRFGRRG